MHNPTTSISNGQNTSNATSSEPPDLSNPYAYPENVGLDNHELIGDEMNFHAADPDTSFDNINMSNKHNSDPAIDKLKSLFWKKAGGLQRTLGSIANFDTWEEFGKLLQREADIDYNDAVSRLQRGEASRLHGEYDRLMGYLNYAIGHVAGDNEMQAKANDRLQKAMKEIDKSSDK